MLFKQLKKYTIVENQGNNRLEQTKQSSMIKIWMKLVQGLLATSASFRPLFVN